MQRRMFLKAVGGGVFAGTFLPDFAVDAEGAADSVEWRPCLYWNSEPLRGKPTLYVNWFWIAQKKESEDVFGEVRYRIENGPYTTLRGKLPLVSKRDHVALGLGDLFNLPEDVNKTIVQVNSPSQQKLPEWMKPADIPVA